MLFYVPFCRASLLDQSKPSLKIGSENHPTIPRQNLYWTGNYMWLQKMANQILGKP
jgi:hypothetical protein